MKLEVDIAPHLIKGYFKTKLKRNLSNVNDFISKMRKTEILEKFLS